jgi:hypothetical protein
MAHKVILPPKKNYIPQFLKQRDINSYKMIHLLQKMPLFNLKANQGARKLSYFIDFNEVLSNKRRFEASMSRLAL